MKRAFFSVLFTLLLPLTFYAQTFYMSNDFKQFKLLSTKGITYLRSHDDSRNEAIEEALLKNWTATPFNVVDAKDPNLSSNTIVLTELRLTMTIEQDLITSTTTETILAMIKLGDLLGKDVSKYAVIGYICVNGFNQKEQYSENNQYMGFAITALNRCVEIIKREEITGEGLSFYKKLEDWINPKVAMLKGKTLLGVGETYDFIKTKALERVGIKYMQVSEAELAGMPQAARDTLCLLYFGFNSSTDVCIFDLKDNSLIYTHHYVNRHKEFDWRDVKRIIRYFN